MEKNRKYSVYIHIAPSNKRYVGITCQQPEKRWRNGKGYKKNQPFFHAIQKYGWDNIIHEIITNELCYSDAANLEKELIKKYRTTDKNYGYNICFGGEDGWVGVHHTVATKEKMSKAKKGKPSGRKGYHLSEETKRKLSESHKGKYHGLPIKPKMPKIKYDENGKIIFSEIHKQRISQGLKGIKRSDKVRENMSRAQVKTKNPVRCIDTGEIFESETEAMKYFGIDKTLIGRNCKGKQKTTKGLRFEYV